MTPLMDDGEVISVLGISRDVSPRKRTEEEFYARGRILEAVVFAAERFLVGRAGAGGTREVLRRLATAAKVDRVAVFQNTYGEDGDVIVSEPTDVAALVRRTVENSDILGTRPVRVEAQLIVVSVDAPKVERIVENLLANAARHTPPHTTIWVRSPRSMAASPSVSRTMGRGSLRSSGSPSSSPSARARTRPATHPAWASACRSWPSSPSYTAAGRETSAPAAGRRSRSSCRAQWPELALLHRDPDQGPVLGPAPVVVLHGVVAEQLV